MHRTSKPTRLIASLLALQWLLARVRHEPGRT